MPHPLYTVFLDTVLKFMRTLPPDDQSKIVGSARALSRGEFENVYIKQIQGNIKELRVRKYRLLFFIHSEKLYFSTIFIKTTQKTPLSQIRIAQKFYTLIAK